MRRLLTLLLAAPLITVALSAGDAAAAGTLPFRTCTGQARTACASLTVPLDRHGHVGGTVKVAVRRVTAGPSPSSVAVVGLAGGPGQAALPLLGDFRRLIAPALGQRDLLLFDQRGTGSSSPLACSALGRAGSPARAAAGCAAQLGARRGSFTTSDSVDDLEAVRQAAGYERLVLFGVSYGTKVALEYAERYPQHVEALVLDSTVDVDGPDPFERSSFAAVGRVLGDLCSAAACQRITASPTGDVAALVGRLTHRPLRGRVFDGRGHARRVTLGRGDLFDVLVAGDENPALRAELPAAVRSALAGDTSPLLRLALLAAGLTPNGSRAAGTTAKVGPSHGGAIDAHGTLFGRGGGTAERGGILPRRAAGAFDPALYVATICEETFFPWSPRNAPPPSRLRQAAQQAAALPPSAIAPFDRLTALLSGPIPTCLDWPIASPPPPARAPLPRVPTLILSGAADLRTPTEDAARVAAQLPGSRVIVVPHTGHSVLGSDQSGCSQAAVRTFFAGGQPIQCAPAANRFRPTPVPPRRLRAVHALPGTRGRPGRTLAVVADSLVDLRREIVGAILGAGQSLPSGARFGGLRGGTAVLTHRGVRLRRFSFVPGVTLSGTVPLRLLATGRGRAARLRVGGKAAAHGTVRLSAKGFSGRLGGRSLRVRAARASAAGQAWPLGSPLGPAPLLVHSS